MRASLFITCFNDTLFPATGQAVVALLERLGLEVDFPLEQTCCGQMHFNTGYAEETVPLVRRFVNVFADSVSRCCGSFVVKVIGDVNGSAPMIEAPPASRASTKRFSVTVLPGSTSGESTST